MISTIHSFVGRYIHVPSNLEKLILFVLLAWIWVLTLRYVGLAIALAVGIYCAVSFDMDTVNIAVCSVSGLMAVLHVIDIVLGGKKSSECMNDGFSD